MRGSAGEWFLGPCKGMKAMNSPTSADSTRVTQLGFGRQPVGFVFFSVGFSLPGYTRPFFFRRLVPHELLSIHMAVVVKTNGIQFGVGEFTTDFSPN